MKRIIVLVMMMLPIVAMAQLPQFSKVANKYSSVEGITSMVINKSMIAMFADGNEDFDFVDEVQILMSEDANVAANIAKDAKKAAKKSKLEELLSANDEGATYTIYTKSKNNEITHLVVIVENDSPAGFVIISGIIPEDKLNDVVKIANM